MTAQVSDALINEHSSLNLDGLHVYGVCRGNPETNCGWGEKYEFKRKPKDTGPMSSACWRGHISTYKLLKDGQLKLIAYQYRGETEIFEEVLTGDFWLVMKTGFDAPRLYFRFRDGKIVCDRAQWLVEEGWVPMRDGLRAALKKAKDHGIEALSAVTLGSLDIRDGQTFAEWVHEQRQGAGC